MSDNESLDLDIENLRWQDLALCGGMSTNLFFDDYEVSTAVATTVDDMCLSCPVMVQCMSQGVAASGWGVWGGVFLTHGKPDQNRNSHKTPEVWSDIRARLAHDQ